MKKNQIIRKNHQFQAIIRSNKQVVSKYVVAYQIGNTTGLRIGISVSKKFANAVYRNKYRRQVRHILDSLDFWDTKKDVILIIRKSFFNLDHKSKTKQIRHILERVASGQKQHKQRR